MSQVNAARHNAVVRARRAINDLAAASCDCPYETERELSDEVKRLRAALAEAIGWSYGDLVTPERRSELESMTALGSPR